MQERYKNANLKHVLELFIKAQADDLGIFCDGVENLSFVLGNEEWNLCWLIILECKQELTLLQWGYIEQKSFGEIFGIAETKSYVFHYLYAEHVVAQN